MEKRRFFFFAMGSRCGKPLLTSRKRLYRSRRAFHSDFADVQGRSNNAQYIRCSEYA